MMTKDEVFKKIQKILVDSLNVDEDEIIPEARIQGDLNAHSIDYLDITFRLEKVFGIKIVREELFPEFSLEDDQLHMSSNGDFTKEGIEILRKRMPFADFEPFEKKPYMYNVTDLHTVGMMHRFICHRLGITA